jgi:hypothetical protein
MRIRTVGIIDKQSKSYKVLYVRTALQYNISEFSQFGPLEYSINCIVQQANVPKGVLSAFLNLVCRCLVGFLGKGICPTQDIFSVQKSTDIKK